VPPDHAVPSPITTAHIAASTDRVIAATRLLDDSAIRSPSRLPGWSVGHVLSHIALNAEAFARCAEDLRAGRNGVMYPHGVAGRNADIADQATRSAAAIADHLAESAAAFTAAWAAAPPIGVCRTAEGMADFPSYEIPLRRLREVEVHGTDSGIAALGTSSWSEAFIRADIAGQLALVRRRTDLHQQRALLAWLLDRSLQPEIDLVGWGDQSRWAP
jgi:maleylpyruvate isomerase